MADSSELQILLEPLRIALQLEVEGRLLFLEAARRASGRHARQTFEFLALEEERHLRRISDFYATIEKKGRPDKSYRPDPISGDRLAQFNSRLALLRDDLKPTQSDIEAFRFAIRFENGAEDFYRRQIESSDDELVCSFYRWLVAEEEIHGQILTSCLEFAEDPAAWFGKQDGNKD